MAIFRWRDRAIFRAPEATLDPDELKLRFRRRTLQACLVVGVAALAYPVLSEKRGDFRTDREVRRMSQALLGARARAALTRSPVGVELVEKNSWQVFEYPGANDCSKVAPANEVSKSPGVAPARLPRDSIRTDNMAWRLLFLDAANTTGVGADVSEVCFHPAQGVLIDSQPLGAGWLYLLVASGNSTQPLDGNAQVRQLVLTNSGADLSLQKTN